MNGSGGRDVRKETRRKEGVEAGWGAVNKVQPTEWMSEWVEHIQVAKLFESKTSSFVVDRDASINNWMAQDRNQEFVKPRALAVSIHTLYIFIQPVYVAVHLCRYVIFMYSVWTTNDLLLHAAIISASVFLGPACRQIFTRNTISIWLTCFQKLSSQAYIIHTHTVLYIFPKVIFLMSQLVNSSIVFRDKVDANTSRSADK